MRKLYIFGLIGVAVLIIGLAFADQMTFTTYYPAPYGVYREMRANLLHANPQVSEPSVPMGEEAKWEGKFYYNDGSGGIINKGLYYYDSSAWQPFGGGGSSYWTLSGTNLYTNNPSCNVGIGIQNPSARLEVNGSVKIDGPLDMSTYRIVQAQDPINPQDVATKAYVDGLVGQSKSFPFSVTATAGLKKSILVSPFTSCSNVGKSLCRTGDNGWCSVVPAGGQWQLSAEASSSCVCVTCNFECYK